MAKKDEAPKAPDYSPVMNALSGIAGTANDRADQQFDWAQDQYADDRGVSDQVIDRNLDTQGQQNEFAGSLQDQYQQTYQPLGDKFAQEAQNYASPDRVASEMGAAAGTTAQAFDQGRMAAQQNLESFGISPASTRFAALDIGAQAQKAAAVAASANTARKQVTDTGLQLEAQAIGHGQVLPSMAAGTLNTGLQAGSGAVNSGLATTASGANTMGTSQGYLGLANNAYGMQGDMLNKQYQNSLDSYKANQESSSGVGAALGAVGGIVGSIYGGPVGGAMGSAAGKGLGGMFAKGGAVGDDDEHRNNSPFVDHHFYVIPGTDEAGHRMPMEEAVKRFFHTGHHDGMYASREHYEKHAAGGSVGDGVAVPTDASPSQGAVTDDIPARLNAGEMVIPKDVVHWFGQKHFYGQIEKAHKDREETKQRTGAVPTHGSAPPQAPSFVSQGAVQ